MSLFQFVHYWALYTPSRRFDINSRLKNYRFPELNFMKLTSTYVTNTIFFLGNVTV